VEEMARLGGSVMWMSLWLVLMMLLMLHGVMMSVDGRRGRGGVGENTGIGGRADDEAVKRRRSSCGRPRLAATTVVSFHRHVIGLHGRRPGEGAGRVFEPAGSHHRQRRMVVMNEAVKRLLITVCVLLWDHVHLASSRLHLFERSRRGWERGLHGG
jgi:hypothetical protein